MRRWRLNDGETALLFASVVCPRGLQGAFCHRQFPFCVGELQHECFVGRPQPGVFICQVIPFGVEDLPGEVVDVCVLLAC
ncbi:hypothetical protein A5637_06575 [Mycolicibacterium fortuitum]|nr:hypothetical protein A5637_06575 [Mycolicibacterium fortuitum]